MEVEEWLKIQSPQMKEICEILRTITLELMPIGEEFIYHNAIGYSVSKSAFDRVTYIAVQNDKYVNYGFFYGNELPDPDKIIQGKGKRMRHVKIFNVEQAQNESLKIMIQTTWKEAVENVSKWRMSLRKK
jgi:Domain of unknown function (DU1801)